MASRADAGDVPLYQPAPEWVVAQAIPPAAKLGADAPTMVLLNSQQQIENARVWSYTDAATRIASPEMLSQLTTLTIPWAPDKGDLIFHQLEILRGSQKIDVLAQGQRFTVLGANSRSSSAS